MILDEIELISSRGSGRFTGSGGSPRLKWTVDNTPERFTLTLRAEEETVLQTVRARFSFAFEKGDLLYLNGYQSGTDSRERPISGHMHSLHRVPGPETHRPGDRPQGIARPGGAGSQLLPPRRCRVPSAAAT